MNLDKKKYKREEVEEILLSVSTEYKDEIAELKERVKSLSTENERLSADFSDLKRQEDLIADTLKDARKRAGELQKKASDKYALEIERLKNFTERFNAYFDYLQEKYPFYPAVTESKKIFDGVKKSLKYGLKESKDKMESLSVNELKSKKSKKPFNPMEKINDYIAATGDNGFNMEEVLNPGNLELGDICKELGLMEEE